MTSPYTIEHCVTRDYAYEWDPRFGMHFPTEESMRRAEAKRAALSARDHAVEACTPPAAP